MADYAIKVPLQDPDAPTWNFENQKTMYGGKRIAAGDRIYLFDSESKGGSGLRAAGVVTFAEAVPKQSGSPRQTPRIHLRVRRLDTARRPLGRRELKSCDDWSDGRPETELNFKLYRQATDKVVGITPATAAFLESFFVLA